MPLYEYECQECHKRFDRIQGINDDPVSECPFCGCEVERVIHPSPIIFKGGGFYVTDSKESPKSKGKAPERTHKSGREK